MSGFSDMEIETEDNKYLTIKAGDTVQFHILSQDPIKTSNHWIEKKKFECKGKNCEPCSQGNKPRKGWTMQVWDRKTLTVKEYEFGNQVAAQIKNIAEILAENQQTVDDIDFRVKREGSTQYDTEYFVNQVPSKGRVTEEEIRDSKVPF